MTRRVFRRVIFLSRVTEYATSSGIGLVVGGPRSNIKSADRSRVIATTITQHMRSFFMKPFALPVLACALLVAVGCGPLTAPLPVRLSPETQKAFDDGWNRSLTPPEKLGHQELLDVLVGTQAYQLGIDTFTFRAEKRFAGGKIVMEAWYDREKPNDDRFEVTVYDTAGEWVRTERYTRKEIEDTYHDLFGITTKDNGVAKEARARRTDYEARLERIRSLFPAKDDQAQEAPKPQPKE